MRSTLRHSLQAAELARVDEVMGNLAAHKAEWAALPIPEKILLLVQIKARLLHQPTAWARAAAQEVKHEAAEVRCVSGWAADVS